MKSIWKKAAALAALATLSLCFVFSACGGVADNTEHFDDITKTLKLTKTYDGKKLMSGSDGIEEAGLIGDTTDGDTTTFKLKSGGYVTVRYQGVDTPESTYEVQKWGKAASQFTNERLHEATLIVLESASGGIPDKDSVGGRSLCYVWYKTAKDDFKLLNLELVENGFSYNKEDADNAYYPYFQKAEQFARGIELRLFSKLDDPLFDTSAIQFSIKNWMENKDKYHENTKILLDAYAIDWRAATSRAVTLTVAQFDEDTNKQYSMTLYAGHTNSTSNMRIGDLYHIAGTLGTYEGSWQITGVTIVSVGVGKEGAEEESWRKQLSYYLTFDSSSEHFINELSSNCYGDVTVTDVKLEGSTLTFKGTAQKIDNGGTPEFTFTVTVPENYNDSIKVGTKLSVNGCFQYEAGSSQLTVKDFNNITIK